MMFKRRIRKAMLTALTVAGLVTLTAGSAFAATPTTGHTVTPKIDAAASDAGDFWTYANPDFIGSPNQGYACVQGVDYLRSNGSSVPNPVKSVINECYVRVYLQYADGHSDCVNPRTSRNIVDSINWNPDGVKIGNSANSC